MLVVTIHGEGDDQRFVVHEATADGKNVVDVTSQYEVHALTCEDASDMLVGWHIARREPKPPCVHLSTSFFVDGWAVCAQCGVEVDGQRNLRTKE